MVPSPCTVGSAGTGPPVWRGVTTFDPDAEVEEESEEDESESEE